MLQEESNPECFDQTIFGSRRLGPEIKWFPYFPPSSLQDPTPTPLSQCSASMDGPRCWPRDCLHIQSVSLGIMVRGAPVYGNNVTDSPAPLGSVWPGSPLPRCHAIMYVSLPSQGGLCLPRFQFVLFTPSRAPYFVQYQVKTASRGLPVASLPSPLQPPFSSLPTTYHPTSSCDVLLKFSKLPIFAFSSRPLGFSFFWHILFLSFPGPLLSGFPIANSYLA